MPRRSRLTLSDVPLHVIQRGNNRQALFFEAADYRFFLDLLVESARKNEVRIHAYVLMTNHLHLLLSAHHPDAPGKTMKLVGQRYVQFVNRKYRRTGSLWEGRFRSCPVQEELYLLACQRYIELNPVRARMVTSPEAYPWSSYRANALGEEGLVENHPVYLDLGASPEARQAAYRELFSRELDPEMVNRLREATNGNFALGNKFFAGQISTVLGRRAERGTPGRPRKPRVGKDQLDLPSE